MKNPWGVVCSLLFSISAFGQIANPVIAGLPVHCADATGAPVYTILQPIPNDVAQSSIAGPMAVRIIKLDPQKFSSAPPILQLFVYAHECGHHVSGDIVAGVFFRHDNPQREMNADRIGIRMMRDQLNTTLQQAQIIASFFVNNPAMPPYYLPGPQRAKWIVDCYKSTNTSCNDSDADYSKKKGVEKKVEEEPDEDKKVTKKEAEADRKRSDCRDDYDECIDGIISMDECISNNVNACSSSCTNPYLCDCRPQRFRSGCALVRETKRDLCKDHRDECLRKIDSDNSDDDDSDDDK